MIFLLFAMKISQHVFNTDRNIYTYISEEFYSISELRWYANIELIRPRGKIHRTQSIFPRFESWNLEGTMHTRRDLKIRKAKYRYSRDE